MFRCLSWLGWWWCLAGDQVGGAELGWKLFDTSGFHVKIKCTGSGELDALKKESGKNGPGGDRNTQNPI